MNKFQNHKRTSERDILNKPFTSRVKSTSIIDAAEAAKLRDLAV